MSSIPETLRAHAKVLAEYQDTYEAEQMACDAGAQAYELAEFIASRGFRQPYYRSEAADWTCSHCFALWKENEEAWHMPDCLWLRARSLLHGSPQP